MITIDYQDRRPIYEQIVERMELLIVRGVLEEGEQIPSVRQTAADLSLNPNTVQKAYAILESEGYIYSVKGRGLFVAPSHKLAEDKRSAWMEKFSALIKEGQQIGITAMDCNDKIDELYQRYGHD